MPVKINSVDVSKIAVGKVEDNMYIKSQKQALLSYDSDQLVVQTPHFLVESYGIPQQSSFYATSKSRSFFKMPFCHDRKQYEHELDYDAIAEMFEKFKEIDNYFSSKELKIKLFGDKLDKYEYQPLIRYPDENEENNKYYRPPYTKIKLDLDYETEKPKYNLICNTNGKRTEITLKTFDGTMKYLKYLTRTRFIIYFHKLYINKNSIGNDKKKYGVILRARCIECMNKVKIRDNLMMFDDEDEVEEERALED